MRAGWRSVDGFDISICRSSTCFSSLLEVEARYLAEFKISSGFEAVADNSADITSGPLDTVVTFANSIGSLRF